MLWTKHLVRLYEYLFCILLILVSYHCNLQAYNSSASSASSLFHLILQLDLAAIWKLTPNLFYAICNLATQSVLASGYLFVSLGPIMTCVRAITALSFLAPSFALLLPIHNEWIPLWATLIPCIHSSFVAVYFFPNVGVSQFIINKYR